MNASIALLTDFGTHDTYVGVMKGVMQRIAPDVHFIDITHEIAPQNVQQAAFALLNSYRYFAPGTIFLVVVDPGVGSVRKPIAVQAGDYFFVAPDNGVLSYVLAEFEQVKAVELSNEAYQLRPLSYTFHGRDIFAPAAAHLAAGVPLSNFGIPVNDIVKLMLPKPIVENGKLNGQVLYNDHFGNIVTNIGSLKWLDTEHLIWVPLSGINTAFPLMSARDVIVQVKDMAISGIHRTYAEVETNQLIALVGSSGFLEIAMNQGSAAQALGLSPNDSITLQIG